MDTFTQGLQVTAVGMVLVFMSLVIVAVLIWALDKIFRPPAAAPEAPRARPAPVSAGPVAAAPKAASGLADQAAALAVALVLGQQRGQALYAPVATYGRVPMPWERPVIEDDVPSQGEIVTVIAVEPGPGNWKSQGRLGAME
jgi:Na+-transporting methylmalonyl-CoA/oxaloacetate decarboxylase gamma subunit